MGKKKYTVDLSEDERKLNGEDEAHLIALARGDPPDGRRRWTLRLLADELVAPEETDVPGTVTREDYTGRRKP